MIKERIKKRIKKMIKKRIEKGIRERIKKMTKNMITMMIKKDLLRDRPGDEALFDLNEHEEDVDVIAVDHEPIDLACKLLMGSLDDGLVSCVL